MGWVGGEEFLFIGKSVFKNECAPRFVKNPKLRYNVWQSFFPQNVCYSANVLVRVIVQCYKVHSTRIIVNIHSLYIKEHTRKAIILHKFHNL